MAVERQIAELTERLESLSEELADTRAERQRLVHELTERSRAQSQAREEVTALEQRLLAQGRDLSARSDSMSAKTLAAAVRELDRELGARLSELGAARSQLEADRFEAARREEELRDRAEAVEQRLAEAERELAGVLARLDIARDAHAGALDELAEARARSERLNADITAAGVRIERLEADAARAHEEIRTLRDALDTERRTRSSIEGRLAWHAHQLRARETELNAAGRTIERLQGVAEERNTLAAQRRTALEERDRQTAERARALRERDQVEAERKRVVEQLRVETDRAAQSEALVAARAREHQQLIGDLGLRLSDVRADVERISRSRAWRWGHRITRTLRLVTFRKPITEGAVNRAIKRLDEASAALGMPTPPELGRPAARAARAKRTADAEDADDSHPRRRPDPAARAELAGNIRSRLGAVPELDEWPRVSIVVLNRNGADHLRALFTGLTEATDYPDLEVVVVDNASTDDSLAFLRGADPAFPLQVIANPENASFSEGNNQGAAAATGSLLLFANNDIEPFEPGWLREMVACEAEGIGAVGATLLHAEGREPAGVARYAVQHRGIRFRDADGMPKGFNVGGDDPLATHLGVTADVPAVTAACMLVARARFESVGGFSSGYRYGTEDVDLGLKLRAAGAAVVCSGRAIVLHKESATQAIEGRDFMRANRTVNRRLLLERWGPQLTREVTLDRLGGNGFWTDGRPPHVAITRTSNDPQDGWGDWYTATELGHALEGRGWQVTFVQRKGDDWYSLPADIDFLLVLMDVYDLPRAGGVPAVAWIRNWTERWLSHAWFDDLYLVLASSSGSAGLIEAATGRVPAAFPIATNPERFRRLPPEPELEADYVFTGNYWGVRREVQDAIDPQPGERVRVYGKDWEGVRELALYSRGPAAYERLPAIYSSAKVVIDDTAGPTLPYGAVNSRVFDALACGAAVVTNCAAGVRELFDDDFPVWDSRESLRTQLDRLLSDDSARRGLVDRYRARVLEEHSYARRAEQLAESLRRRAEAMSFCIKIGAPDREQAERWGDLYFARSLRRQLERRGHPSAIQVLDEWDNEAGLAYDVVIQLRGLSRYRPKPGQFNVLWVISHPELVSAEECDGFDLVAVASERFADELRELTQAPVVVLEQATDPEVFFPGPDDAYRHDIAYVGNSRNVLRKGLADLLPTNRDVAVYGSNWDRLIDPGLVVAEHIPNGELHKVYSSSAIVLNDHWDDMRRHGFVSNRIFDVLASGGLVVSDAMPELERFGEGVVTYERPDELNAILDRLLADPEERRRRSAGGRELVLSRDTFAHRAEQLLGLIAEQMPRQGFQVRVGAASLPTRAQASRIR